MNYWTDKEGRRIAAVEWNEYIHNNYKAEINECIKKTELWDEFCTLEYSDVAGSEVESMEVLQLTTTQAIKLPPVCAINVSFMVKSLNSFTCQNAPSVGRQIPRPPRQIAKPTIIGFAIVVVNIGAIRDAVVTRAVAEDPSAAFKSTDRINAITNNGMLLADTIFPNTVPIPDAEITAP